MKHTGAFHTAFRTAVSHRGLTLTRLRDRLVDQGLAVSVSTLSNWQRGTSRPAGGDSTRVLTALEKVLRVDAGSLTALVDDGPSAGRWRELGPGTSPQRIRELRSRLGFPEGDGPTVLSAMDDVVVGGRGTERHMRSRLVLRAAHDTTDRHVVFAHSADGRHPPGFHAGEGCEIARVETDPETGLAAAELRFAPMARGETCPVAYGVRWTDDDSYYGRWIRGVGLRFELTVRFGEEARVRSAYRVWRVDARSPHKDVVGVRLIGDGLAHLLETDPNPGFHGIRWE